MNKNNYWMGIILILLGLYLLMDRVLHFEILDMGTIIFLGIGLFFEVRYFKSKSGNENLVIGGLFLTMGVLRLLSDFPILWSLGLSSIRDIPLGISVGLFQLYIFSNKDSRVLIGALALMIFSIFPLLKFYFTWISSEFLFPILLIVFGVLFLINALRKDS
ncbi:MULTISPECIES: hypothetical protein [Clostridium]|uniref:DUF5668 domain-containing protein n=1 Tax=Clostridium cadaveris TaxID=1529 RepID=A0A1I2NU92_9CLOT|nr:hypothetical protein [Clostridium cadaveris]MDU4952887.1 hypothetical protein [Clostridium sp.]MDM8312554.1 hypothetical protein [Clostridium cadaveris]MDY4949423.1 hypothetical protein [Clostridium cadaveris]NME65733.1 hypothetical protein [Clostridium cadaveris]NWK12241.1 hypothetical protein [Clostridium cadaveris]